MIKETFSKIQLLLQRKGLTRETATGGKGNERHLGKDYGFGGCGRIP